MIIDIGNGWRDHSSEGPGCNVLLYKGDYIVVQYTSGGPFIAKLDDSDDEGEEFKTVKAAKRWVDERVKEEEAVAERGPHVIIVGNIFEGGLRLVGC